MTIEVRPEGIIRDADGNERGVVLHHIVGEDGLTDRERNTKLQHNIPLYTLVEVVEDPDFPNCEDGLRLFVAEHTRDCDGTPLYSLTFDLTREPLGVKPPADEHPLVKWTRVRDSGYAEESLKVIRPAEEVIARMKREGWLKPDGSWYRDN